MGRKYGRLRKVIVTKYFLSKSRFNHSLWFSHFGVKQFDGHSFTTLLITSVKFCVELEIYIENKYVYNYIPVHNIRINNTQSKTDLLLNSPMHLSDFCGSYPFQ